MNRNAVFDTVVLLQGAAKPNGPAGRCLRLDAEGRAALSMSAEGLAEIADVLGREKVRRRFPQWTVAGIAHFLQNLRSLVRMVADVPLTFSFARDPDDEHIVNLAIAAGATFIVSRDNDLNDLMKDDNADGVELRQQYPSLTILDPVAFLAIADATDE